MRVRLLAWVAIAIVAGAGLPDRLDAATEPAGSASPTQLFIHLGAPGIASDVPLNTQEPPGDVSARQGPETIGSLAPCGPVAGVPMTSAEAFTVYAFGYAAAVDYSMNSPGPVQGELRGIGFTAALDSGAGMTLHWFIETPAAQPAPTTPIVIPNVVVRATLRSGEAIQTDSTGYNNGTVLAQGQSPPALLAGPATQGANYTEVDGRGVYEFTVPLTIALASIPGDRGFNLRVDTYVETPACSTMGPLIVFHSSPGHRPRLALSVFNPVRIDVIRPREDGGAITLQASVQDVWGRYDLRDPTLAVRGPSTPSKLERLTPPGGPSTKEFAPHLPLVLAWRWNHTREGAAAGNYTARIEVSTLQSKSVAARSESEFFLQRSNGSPGVGAVGLMVALVGLAGRRRRQARR